MSVKGRIKEGPGFMEEETGGTAKSRKMAHKGHNLRSKGQMAGGKVSKPGESGTGHKE